MRLAAEIKLSGAFKASPRVSGKCMTNVQYMGHGKSYFVRFKEPKAMIEKYYRLVVVGNAVKGKLQGRSTRGQSTVYYQFPGCRKEIRGYALRE